MWQLVQDQSSVCRMLDGFGVCLSVYKHQKIHEGLLWHVEDKMSVVVICQQCLAYKEIHLLLSTRR